MKRLKKLLPSKRKIIQLYAALLFNANIKGFINGEIYKGSVKNFCAPGINCYSCPGAVGACPLGSLQNALANSEKRPPFYIFGILILYGIILGRTICGFLCPFGLIQELFHKIPTPKLKKNTLTRALSIVKYVILVFFVGIVPILYGIRDIPLPAFCKYICPAGTFEGALGLLSNQVNSGLFSALGPLFTWKFLLMVSFLLGSVFIFRFFCRFFCPLGALYGLFNKFSLLGVKVDKTKCTSCGLCISECQMDIRHVGDRECIGCGECIPACPTGAIRFNGSKYFIVPTLEKDATEIEKQDHAALTAKISKRNKVIKIVTGSLSAVLLIGALVYFNFIDKPAQPVIPPDTSTDTSASGNITVGNKVGNLCPGYDIPLFDQNGETGEIFNPAKNGGRITVVNFWGTWCGGCVKELPDFDRIASEYSENVTIVAVHTVLDYDTAADYVGKHFPNSEILFGKDELLDPTDRYSPDKYFSTLGGTDSYPITIVLDEEGVIIATVMKDTDYGELKAIIDEQLAK